MHFNLRAFTLAEQRHVCMFLRHQLLPLLCDSIVLGLVIADDAGQHRNGAYGQCRTMTTRHS